MSLNFTKSKANSNLYFKVDDKIPMMLLLYVDDMFLKGEDRLIEDTLRRLATEFEMKEIGMMHYLLGMEVWQSTYGIFLGQGKFTVDILKRFKILDCKEIAIPMESNLKLLCDASSYSIDAMMYHQMIDSLMYLNNTRPNIWFSLNTLS